MDSDGWEDGWKVDEGWMDDRLRMDGWEMDEKSRTDGWIDDGGGWMDRKITCAADEALFF